jgi:20S proteasome alpha/beta subunit
MTVCIGAICEDGKAAVVAADKMVTFGPPMMLQTEPSVLKKIVSLTPECVILFSGSMPDGEDVIARARPGIAATKQPVSNIAEKVRGAYADFKKARVEETILRPLLGADFAQFQALVGQSSSSQILQQLVGMIMQHNLQLEALIAGTDDSGAHIFVIGHPGILQPVDTTGFAAIGSGGLHAMIALSLGPHSKTASLVETIHSVYEAKKAAEVAPGVGTMTDMAIIKGSSVCVADKPLFEALEGIRKERPSLSKNDRERLQGACDDCVSKQRPKV